MEENGSRSHIACSLGRDRQLVSTIASIHLICPYPHHHCSARITSSKSIVQDPRGAAGARRDIVPHHANVPKFPFRGNHGEGSCRIPLKMARDRCSDDKQSHGTRYFSCTYCPWRLLGVKWMDRSGARMVGSYLPIRIHGH